MAESKTVTDLVAVLKSPDDASLREAERRFPKIWNMATKKNSPREEDGYWNVWDLAGLRIKMSHWTAGAIGINSRKSGESLSDAGRYIIALQVGGLIGRIAAIVIKSTLGGLVEMRGKEDDELAEPIRQREKAAITAITSLLKEMSDLLAPLDPRP